MRSSLILRCLRMGFVRGDSEILEAECRSRRSCVDARGALSTESGTGAGLGGGVHSTALCSGP